MDRAEQKHIRLQMLAIMNADKNWLTDEEKVKKVQQLAALLTAPPPLCTKKRAWTDFSRGEFLYLLSKGYMLHEIATLYNASNTRFVAWRKMHGFEGKTAAQILQENQHDVQEILKQKEESPNSSTTLLF